MPHLSIRVLGPFQVSLDGEPVSGFASDKVRALLAYLALSADRPHRREALAGLLWPEFPERSARSSLRNALANLRHVIRDSHTPWRCLHATRQTIRFNGQSDHWLDADAFEGLATAVPPTTERLEQAVSLVRGPFLEGFSLADAAPFEEWQLLRREHLGRQVVEAYRGLAAIYEGLGANEQALAHARRRVELEPWQEEGQRQLMRLLALTGRRSEALALYERLNRSLQEEFGAEPSAETRALYESIRSGELAPEPGLPTAHPAPVWNLPASPTPFFGRVDELAALEERLADPESRLLTITGPGGSGKTRLALELGVRAVESDRQALGDGLPLLFPHGIVFVPLAAVDAAEGLAPALAAALELRLQGGQEQLVQALRRRQILLILDNLEHLLAGVELLAEIVRAAPGVTILATSRERLQLQGERISSLLGLSYPDHDLGPSSPEAADLDACVAVHPAFQLLVESARRVEPHFDLSPPDLPLLLEICRQVDGLPLALELAASWADTLSMNDILAETRKSLGFLEADWRDAPERHRSIRAVLDVSWRRLDQSEKTAFSQVSVFRGGFSRDAAAHVVMGTAATSRLLATLVRKSFLQHDQAKNRYQVHELLRQYGAEKLAVDPTLEAVTRDLHSRYYCDLLNRPDMVSEEAVLQPLMEAIQEDVENVRAACLWAANHGRASRLVQAVHALGWFYYRGYGNHGQGENTFRGLGEALVAAETWPSSPLRKRYSAASASARRTMARVLGWQITFRQMAADPKTAKRLIHEGTTLLDGLSMTGEDTRLERAHIAFQSGYNLLYPQPGKARQHFAESIRLYREIGHKLGMAYALLGLGRATSYHGAQEEAREAMAQSLSLHRDLGNQVGECETVAELGGLVAAKQFRFKEAEDLIRRSLSLAMETDRFGIAYGLGQLCAVQLRTGQFVEAETSSSDGIAIWEDLGLRAWTVRTSIVLAEARLHMGAYHAARLLAAEATSLAQQLGWNIGVSHGKIVLGAVALVEANAAQAYSTLQKSLSDLMIIGDDPRDVHPSAWLGLAARDLEHRAEAMQHLISALDWASRHQEFRELMVALTGISVLLADEGEAERAIELYALASRYPFVANSRWFEDVVGRDIAAAAAATLPPGKAAAARQRGQARDLEATASELLAEFRR